MDFIENNDGSITVPNYTWMRAWPIEEDGKIQWCVGLSDKDPDYFDLLDTKEEAISFITEPSSLTDEQLAEMFID